MKKVSYLIGFILVLFLTGCFGSDVSYTVSFDSKGGTQVESIKTDGKSSLKLPADPVLEGYEFVGWYFDDNTFLKKFEKDSFVKNALKENVKLYAKYEPIEYKLNFYDGEVLLEIEPSTYTVNDTVELPTLTKDGYMFLGWYDHPYDEFDSEKLIRHILKGSTGDKSFYAVFGEAVLSFNVVFKDGEEILKTELVEQGKDATPPIAEVKEGYNFVGWNKDYNNVTGDLVVNTIYELISYSVKFYDESVLLDLPPNSYSVLDLVNLPTPTKDGFEFVGWYLDANLTNKVDGITKGSTGDKEFYAKWEEVASVIEKVNVVFNTLGGTPAPEALELDKGEKTTEPATPKRDGYKFLGWLLEGVLYDFNTPVNEDIVLVAKWQEITCSVTYNVTFKGADGEVLKTEVVEENGAATPPAAPAKEGYEFTNWDKAYNNINQDIVITATYKIIDYVIKFYDGSDLLDLEPKSFTILDSVTLPSPTKEGYDFVGWYDTSGLTNKVVNLLKGTIGNQSFYAKWEKIEEGNGEEIVVPVGAFTMEIQYITVYGIKLGPTAPDASRMEYDWSSSDESVVTISAYSTITPVSPGFAIITGTYKADPSKKGYLLVKVEGTEVREADPSEVGGGEEAIKYTIEFYDGSKLLDLEPKTYTELDLVTFPTPTKWGYNFVGWYDSSDLVNRVVNLFIGTTGNKKFYAKWEKVEEGDEPEFVVPKGAFTFKVQFGTVYGIAMDSNAPTASRTAYDWSSSDESVATISAYSTITPVSPGFAILTATYLADRTKKGYLLIKVEGTTVREADPSEVNQKTYYTVTFVDDLNNVIETQEVLKGMSATLPTPPKKAGKLFFGWDKTHTNIQGAKTIKASYINGDVSFEGKKVTIIGTSSSTFLGTMPEEYSNFYPYPVAGVVDVNQMWWQQLINKLGMQLLINNSASATTVKSIGGKQTATEMDARLANSHVGNEMPDYIFISMGLNDCRSNVSLADFKAAYNVMLSKLKTAYPNAQIILCNLTTGPYTTGYGDIAGYNQFIKQTAIDNNFPLIDKEKAININNYESLIVDSVHPNEVGMDKLAEQTINDFLDYYGIKP